MRTLIPFALCLVVLAPSSFAQNDLAEQLPAQTQLYFEIPDMASFRAGFESSTSSRIWNDPEIQGFVEELLPMVEEGFGELRSALEEEGFPGELLDCETFQGLSFGVAVGDVMSMMMGEPQVSFAARVVFSDAEVAAQFFSGLKDANDEHHFTSQSFEGGQSIRLENPNDPAGLEIEVRGNAVQFVGTIGAEMDGSLADNPAFRAAGRGDGEMFAYLDMASFMKMAESVFPMFPDGVGDLLSGVFSGIGLDSLGVFSCAGGWNNGDSVTSGSISFVNGKPTGLIGSIGNVQALDLDLASYVPSEATTFSLSSTDPSGGWDFVNTLMYQGIAIAKARGVEIPEELPISAWLTGDRRQDIGRSVAMIGPRSFSWGVMDATALMGGGSSKGGSFTEVRDVALVREITDAFYSDLADTLSMIESPVTLHSKNLVIREKNDEGKWVSREGPAYWTLKISMSSLPQELAALQMVFAQIQPSWGITDDGWLVQGQSSAPVRRAMRSGVKKAETPITSNAEVASFLNRLPENAMKASWADSRPLIGGAITMAQGFLPMLAGLAEQNGAPLPFDLSKFPSGDAFTRHMRPSESLSLYQNGKLSFYSVGSFGLAEALFSGAALGAGIGFISLDQEGSFGSPASAPGPGGVFEIEKIEEEDAPFRF